MQALRLRVSEHERGERLDLFVSRLAGITRASAQRLISSGAVRVDGDLLQKNHHVRAGECVEIQMPEPEEAEPLPQDIAVDIVYQDGDIAVIDKPPGLVVHPAAGHREGTLVNALLYALDGLSGVGGVMRPGIVHRLDRDTSGLMVVAKNDLAHVRLQESVRERSLQRLYIALVHGVPATRLGTIDAPIGRDPRDRKRMAVVTRGGKPSVTRFVVQEDLGDFALLEVELASGRTHQIRVHMAHIGHPVVGDREYGVKSGPGAELGLERQFLHAYSLSFEHPVRGEEMHFSSPLPEDLKVALQRLRAV